MIEFLLGLFENWSDFDLIRDGMLSFCAVGVIECIHELTRGKEL